ncbi:membrane protein insertase YidC [Neobacillus muris]|uniref:membrane protein insertase YidC n=1 Tax=Neobacillus muris TaxID=2941334 RepID=UPI00203E10EB|nr:membrane protein insertase YidC [Neobacillus muris]
MRKKHSSLILFALLSLTVLVLSACSGQSTQAAQTGNNDGFFHTYFVEPFTFIINFFADFFNGNYGLAIILVTLIVRLALMPLMLRQYKNSMAMKEKMDKLKPEMDEIQKRLKAEKDPQKQKAIQAEMMGLYQKHGVNPLNMGCLPLLIQMPILTGFYYAIRGSQEIAHHKFLWFSLGQPDIVITILAGVIYYLQFKVQQTTMPEAQRQQMKIMGLMSPLMIVMFSFSAPAALPLYWVVGGIFLTIQTMISHRLYQPKKTNEIPAKQK